MGRYTDNDKCDWCGESPAQSYPVEKRGTLVKRYEITVSACAECARRLGLAGD